MFVDFNFKDWKEEVIECPYCGEQYTHQKAVWVFNRGEDDDVTMVTRVLNPTYGSEFMSSSNIVKTKMMPSKICPNPSSRRQGILIELECEMCCLEEDPENEDDAISTEHNDFYCTIAQHKGETLVSTSMVLEENLHPNFKKEFNKD